MLDRIVADRAQFQRLFDSPVDVRHPEALKEPQNLDVFALALLAHARFQQPVQGGKLPWQVPAPAAVPPGPARQPSVPAAAGSASDRRPYQPSHRTVGGGRSPRRRSR